MTPLAALEQVSRLGPLAQTAGVGAPVPLHGGVTGGEPHVVVVVLAVVGLWGLIAGLVVAVDRLLGRVVAE